MSFNLCQNPNEPGGCTCDIILKIGNYEFFAHRNVLIARMKYFRNILTSTCETKKVTVALDLEAINSACFNDFLIYVYTSEIDFTNENLREISKIADYFRFDELIDKVIEHMKNNLKVENVVYFQTIASELGLKSLGDVFADFLCQELLCNTYESSKEKLVSTLSFEPLQEILEKLKKTEKFEKMLYYSVDWILGDEVNRFGKLLELLKNIPLERLSFNFLKQTLFHYELIGKNYECLQLFFDAFITASKSDVREEKRQKTYSLYAIGGLDQRTRLSSVSRYHHSTRKWTPVTEIHHEKIFFSCAVIGHKIYVCGGSQRKSLFMKKLTVFDTYFQTWTKLSPMKHARDMCASAVLNRQIYVAGGKNNNGLLLDVERYNVQTDRWEDVASMTTKRMAFELVALNGFLYAIGGLTGENEEMSNSVERYNPQTDQWTQMKDTNNKYQAFGSAVLNSKIYILGTSNFEVYSSAEDKWTEMPAPSECESGRRLAVYNRKLFAIGGSVGQLKDFKGSKTVEVFNFQTSVWRPETDMNVARCYHGVAVVESLFFDQMKMSFDTSKNLNELRLQEKRCDVILEIGGHEFPVHSAVLIARMEYFRNILRVPAVKEPISLGTRVSVISFGTENIDLTSFREILNYIYTSKITFTNENIRSIYKTAEYFCFDELIYEVKEHMEFTVNIENVRTYLPIAIEFGFKPLQGLFTQHIFKQIFSDNNKFSRKKLIPTSSLEHLKILLQELKKNEKIEDMFHYAVDWIVHDEVSRSERLLELFNNIPLQKLELSFLIEVVSQNSLIRRNEKCLNLLLNAVITLPYSHSESHRDILYAIGGCDEVLLSSVSQYNSTIRKWIATTPMPSKRSHFGCAVVGHKIYVCGGHDEEQNHNELIMFDTLTQTWKQLRPMKHARYNCAVAAIDEQIYVAGGWNETEILAVVERYNVRNNRWEDVASMTTERCAFELVVVNGFLYAIGGAHGGHTSRETMNTVERYDPQIDLWTPINNTNNIYIAFGSAVLNNNIYIVGEDKCEVYNAEFKRWTEMPAPNTYTNDRRVVVFDGKLCTIGGGIGETKNRKGSKTVEVYDFQERAWKPEPDMDVARCFHGLAVVKH